MKICSAITTCLVFLAGSPAYALEPEQILVIANTDVAESVQIGQYYCAKRGVPANNIVGLPLGTSLSATISRENYDKQLAEPIRTILSDGEFSGKIRCLLTTYGVPIKVAGRGPLRNHEDKLQQLEKLVEQETNKLGALESKSSVESAEQKKIIVRRRAVLQSEIDRIAGKETNASVDSELSMVLFGDYELYRWQPNMLKNGLAGLSFNTLMVSRLDGPGPKIAQRLIDKAMTAEQTQLKGVAYIDSRGIAVGKTPYSYGYFDQSLRDLAELMTLGTTIPVKQERTERLFEPGACPNTAIYCGWYSVKRYVDAFDFVEGAIGYHISSWEAVDLRDPNSTQWCPAMLSDGITATLGAVAEPYLLSFPEPKAFFLELFNGHCLAEAYYRTKPFNSWQLVLIGDPLYQPFRVTGREFPPKTPAKEGTQKDSDNNTNDSHR